MNNSNSMVMSRRPARNSESNNLNAKQSMQVDSSSPDKNAVSEYSYAKNATAMDKRHRSWFWLSSPSSSSAALFLRRSQLFLVLKRLEFNVRRNPMRWRAGIFGVLFLWINYLLGPRGSIKGGQLGVIYDIFTRDISRYRTIKKWRGEVASLGLKVGELPEPWYVPFDGIIRSRPNYAVVEMLLRENERIQKLRLMSEASESVGNKCINENLVHIPRTIIQLVDPHQDHPLLPPYWIVRSSSIDVDNIDIKRSDMSLSFLQGIQNCNDDLQCMAYHLGGIQLSYSFTLQTAQPFIRNILSMIQSSTTSGRYNMLGGGTCNTRVGYAVLSSLPTPEDELRKSAVASRASTIFAAFPPDHPGHRCIPQLEQSIGISPYNEANEELSIQSTFVNKLFTELDGKRRDNNRTKSVWGVATLPCNADNLDDVQNCCNRASVSIIDSADAKEGIVEYLETKHIERNSNHYHHLIFTSSPLDPPTNIMRSHSTQLSVKISERSQETRKSAGHEKETIQMELRKQWCEPRWFCNRCLQSSLHGSFSTCASTCGECAANVICIGGNESKMKPVKVDVEVTRHQIHLPNAVYQNRIPRIIHQTYFEEITIDKYPQLFRLQNTWKASGWEYRFYTDDTARQYIKKNYPSRFLSVFDSLIPGAYKADFFRYLVLFNDGGVYADVDVMLETNLDAFVSPDLAFFAPLDAVGNYADEPFCVWNGLIGSAPAHPALTNVIEWMVNLVSSRGDVYDLERAVCRFSGIDKVENWKVRAEPSLLLSGPCALGLAVNNAIGNEPLSKFRAGLLKRKWFNEKNIKDLDSDAIGNVLFLVADKDDLGAFRFSDPERNIMIATTELAGLNKSPTVYEKDAQHIRGQTGLKQKPHYSTSTQGQHIWGSRGVYADSLVENELVSLVVSYNDRSI